MSRIGKVPVSFDSSVKVLIDGQHFKVHGKNGELSMRFPQEVSLSVVDSAIVITPLDQEDRRSRSMWGLSRALVYNMVKGVSDGWYEHLEMTGVGYKASVSGNIVVLSLGYSHDVVYALPEGISARCEKPTSISIFGADKQMVGQVAAEIRQLRKPEPYKGKGLRYRTEKIKRKESKKK